MPSPSWGPCLWALCKTRKTLATNPGNVLVARMAVQTGGS